MADVYFVCSDASYCHRYRGDVVRFLSGRDSFGGVTDAQVLDLQEHAF